MLEEKIQRINELYRKSKAEGLTEAELKSRRFFAQNILRLSKAKLTGTA